MGRRIGIYLLGLSITSLGIALVILSKAGAGPWDIVAVGLNKHLGFTIGTWSIIAQGMVVLMTSLIERKRPQFESIVAIIIRSWILDAWIYIVFRNADLGSSWGIQWGSYFLGVLATGLGIGTYLLAELPKTPIDGLMVAIHHRLGWSLNFARTVIEFSAALLGYLLDGPAGLGTIIIVLTLGKMIQISNQKLKRILITQTSLPLPSQKAQ